LTLESLSFGCPPVVGTRPFATSGFIGIGGAVELDHNGSKENAVIRKAVFGLGAALAGALIATQWKDIVRYVKIELMSSGDGHPGVVPAGGSSRYPDNPAQSAPDGTGEFDTASRGGPASSR
jgi:hypothetical protein